MAVMTWKIWGPHGCYDICHYKKIVAGDGNVPMIAAGEDLAGDDTQEGDDGPRLRD